MGKILGYSFVLVCFFLATKYRLERGIDDELHKRGLVFVEHYQSSPQKIYLKPASQLGSFQMISGGLIIEADEQGHYRGEALVNGSPVPFLIDTGATTTVIPLVYASGLTLGGSHSADTAGGKVIQYDSDINNLKLGDAEFLNVPVAINQYLDEMLIGMDVLRYFAILQENNKMTLVLSNSDTEQQAIVDKLNQPVKSSEVIQQADNQQQEQVEVSQHWKKTKQCDDNGTCKTIYGR